MQQQLTEAELKELQAAQESKQVVILLKDLIESDQSFPAGSCIHTTEAAAADLVQRKIAKYATPGTRARRAVTETKADLTCAPAPELPEEKPKKGTA